MERTDTGAAGGGKPFLCCDFNRDGDAFRSHHSNQYFPAEAAGELEDGGVKPSGRVRSLEVAANSVWRMYVEQYYEGGTAAVYCWDTGDDEGEDGPAAGGDGDGFAACFLVKKGARPAPPPRPRAAAGVPRPIRPRVRGCAGHACAGRGRPGATPGGPSGPAARR